MALGPSLISITPLNLVKFTVAVLTTIASQTSTSAPLLDDIRVRTSVGIPQTNSGNISIVAPLTSPRHLNLLQLLRAPDHLTQFHINFHLFKSLVASLKALDLLPLYLAPLASFLQLSLFRVLLPLHRHLRSHLPHRPVLQLLHHQPLPVLQSSHP